MYQPFILCKNTKKKQKKQEFQIEIVKFNTLIWQVRKEILYLRKI